ncbi:MAG: hypothetical protein LBS49_13175 [Candidatus Accumulibacter sp.]|nr:hypothetical protein [Accumulibacter sp.]
MTNELGPGFRRDDASVVYIKIIEARPRLIREEERMIEKEINRGLPLIIPRIEIP